MASSRDFYAILGVLPSAEDIVIRAAYRALAQCYHPDKWTGAKDEAERRMKKINEAYAVLSEPSSRTRYDATRKAQGADEALDPDEEGVRGAFEEAERSTDPDWALAVEYFPDLADIYAKLRKISVSLAFSFKTILLESKTFKSRHKLANSLEHSFLQTYFGSNPEIVAFARGLIASGEKDAAKELNRVVSVLGSDVEAGIIISRLKSKFRTPGEEYSFIREFQRERERKKSR